MSVQSVQYQPINKVNLAKSNNFPINVIPSAEEKDEVSFSAKQESPKSTTERLWENIKSNKFWIPFDIFVALGSLGLYEFFTKKK